jgi:dynein heavy chain
MEEIAYDFQEKYRAFDKDVRDWGIYTFLKNDIEKFIKTLPLITDLRDDAMRERHWKELRIEVKDDFDEHSDEFNLEKVFSLNLLTHEEKISDMCGNARKQLRIEQDLKAIEYAWYESTKSDLFIEKQRSKADNEEYFCISSTDNIIELIEDHGGKLGTMKSSPYYREFDTKIDLWESNIAQITETLELLLLVQGKWRYLESIFRGQPEI